MNLAVTVEITHYLAIVHSSIASPENAADCILKMVGFFYIYAVLSRLINNTVVFLDKITPLRILQAQLRSSVKMISITLSRSISKRSCFPISKIRVSYKMASTKLKLGGSAISYTSDVLD